MKLQVFSSMCQLLFVVARISSSDHGLSYHLPDKTNLVQCNSR